MGLFTVTVLVGLGLWFSRPRNPGRWKSNMCIKIGATSYNTHTTLLLHYRCWSSTNKSIVLTKFARLIILMRRGPVGPFVRPARTRGVKVADEHVKVEGLWLFLLLQLRREGKRASFLPFSSFGLALLQGSLPMTRKGEASRNYEGQIVHRKWNSYFHCSSVPFCCRSWW